LLIISDDAFASALMPRRLLRCIFAAAFDFAFDADAIDLLSNIRRHCFSLIDYYFHAISPISFAMPFI